MRAIKKSEILRLQLCIILLLLFLIAATAVVRHPSWFDDVPATAPQQFNLACA
jgi:hypothetical protein